VVTEAGELRVIPESWQATEISHAVVAEGKPVRAAGDADVSVYGYTRYGLEIRPHSGHYLNNAPEAISAEAEQIGRRAFERHGISFPKGE
jgi:hypothetical protein